MLLMWVNNILYIIYIYIMAINTYLTIAQKEEKCAIIGKGGKQGKNSGKSVFN